MYRFTTLYSIVYTEVLLFAFDFVFIIRFNLSCGLLKYSNLVFRENDVNFAVFAKIPTDSSNVHLQNMTQIAEKKGLKNIESKKVKTNFLIH